MPVITVFGPPLSPAEINLALIAINAATARSLGIPADTVHSTFVAASASAIGTKGGPARPVAVVYAPLPEPTQLAAATKAVASVLGGVWGISSDQARVQWLATASA
ncbi:hypothetical protein ACSMXN_22195 [Jatrophihabitans sp. DSM 45814]